MNCRFVITLDAETRLTPASVTKLVGKLNHPLNHPIFDPQNGEFIKGYSIYSLVLHFLLQKEKKHQFCNEFFPPIVKLILMSLLFLTLIKIFWEKELSLEKACYNIDVFQ
ncbi:hypothetical protein HNQ69_000965 [Bartonella callosciuri]|uniref:Uncharacterized protein n=1 Tax=Bartonella callosciuri TaxID=686223 RepID=A0A840NX65_9HYPH|nr:hypothetical protein [Bartonella callosciuri]